MYLATLSAEAATEQFGFQIQQNSEDSLAAGSFCSTSHTSHAFAVGFPVEGRDFGAKAKVILGGSVVF